MSEAKRKSVTHSWWKLAASIAAICVAAAAQASETITYTYDSRGRLVKVDHAGTVNGSVKTVYRYDKADNRTNVTVIGSPSCSSATPTWGSGNYGCFRWGQ
jgi:hypothetical protein